MPINYIITWCGVVPWGLGIHGKLMTQMKRNSRALYLKKPCKSPAIDITAGSTGSSSCREVSWRHVMINMILSRNIILYLFYTNFNEIISYYLKIIPTVGSLFQFKLVLFNFNAENVEKEQFPSIFLRIDGKYWLSFAIKH